MNIVNLCPLIIKKLSIELYKKTQISQKGIVAFRNYVEDYGLSKDKNKWFGGSGARPKITKS